MKRRVSVSLWLCWCVLLTNCKVGPNYKVPAAPITANFKEPPPSGWKEAEPQDTALRGNWWEVFGDARLTALVEQVSISNQNIAAAEANFRLARSTIRGARADLFPTVIVQASSTTIGVSRSSSSIRSGINVGGTIVTSGNNGGPTTFYQLPIDVSYEADLWGRIRRNIEANIETTQAAAADVENIRLSMQTDLALDYFQLRGLDQEQQILEATIRSFERALELTINRYREGVSSQLDVAQAQTQLETARAQAIDVGVARAQFEHAIAVLIGSPPAEFAIAREDYRMQPPEIPLSLPSELLERRPDIAAAERRTASANAQIGVARAALFPALTFSVRSGLESPVLGRLVSFSNIFWTLGPTFSEIAFDAGRRRAVIEGTEATYDVAAAAYRQNVLTAFQEVEDNLAALRILMEESSQQNLAVTASQRSLELSMNRYRGGITTYLDVIAAQNVLLTNQRVAVGILTRQMTGTVLLIKALGGGWNHAQLPSPNDLK
jgi:NodT family efflux transporter outer membrane factor (OMF) lipoprotein